MKKLINILKNITNHKPHTAHRQLHTAYTAYCLLKNCLLNTAYCILNTACCKLPTAILPTIILIFSQLATAQIYPVQVTPQLIPPYSLKLSDYATTQSEKLIVNLLMTDINENNRELRFKFSIAGNGLQIQSNGVVIGANPIFVDGGIPLRLTNLDLRPYFELQNLNGITPQQYNSPLPNGMYQFCFEVFDWLTGQRLSRKHCFPAYLIINDPPFLNIPSNGDLVEVQNPQNILFNWTPRHLNATGVQYEFELREIWDTQIDPQAAFLATPNLYRTTTINNTLLYGPGETTLLENKTYAWRVRAIAGDGISDASIFKNNGYSEIHYFTYTADCKAPQFPLAKSKSTRSEEITWQPDVNYLRFRVQYRKKGVRDAVWFEVNSQNPYTTLYNLEAGTTYEYRVGGQCTRTINRTEPRYSYTAIQEFTTPIKNEDAAYNCGIVPEINITNREPITNLGVNEVFTAGDFPVTIKQLQGGNGVYSGVGYIVVPYLADTKIAVEFNNIRINTYYQLYQGTLYTTYDASWGNVDDVQDEIDAVVDLATGTLELLDTLIDNLENLIASGEWRDYHEQLMESLEESLPNDLQQKLNQVEQDIIKAQEDLKAAQESGNEEKITEAQKNMETVQNSYEETLADVKGFMKEAGEIIKKALKQIEQENTDNKIEEYLSTLEKLNQYVNTINPTQDDSENMEDMEVELIGEKQTIQNTQGIAESTKEKIIQFYNNELAYNKAVVSKFFSKEHSTEEERNDLAEKLSASGKKLGNFILTMKKENKPEPEIIEEVKKILYTEISHIVITKVYQNENP